MHAYKAQYSPYLQCFSLLNRRQNLAFLSLWFYAPVSARQASPYRAKGHRLSVRVMLRSFPLALLAAFTTVLAQETGANNSTTPTSTIGEITIHTITVGKEENVFQPNSIVATPGDVVKFVFYPTNHSVIRAEYGEMCDEFYSSMAPALTHIRRRQDIHAYRTKMSPPLEAASFRAFSRSLTPARL